MERLRPHGIVLEPVTAPVTSGLEVLTVASSTAMEKPFENHHERTVTGGRTATDATVPAGAWRMPMTEPLARLAAYLLEPRSNDAPVTWNVLDESPESGRAPILRTRDRRGSLLRCGGALSAPALCCPAVQDPPRTAKVRIDASSCNQVSSKNLTAPLARSCLPPMMPTLPAAIMCSRM